MTFLIVLIIFIASFIGLGFLVFKKISILASLPEQTEQSLENPKPIKQNILEKTSRIKQAVLHNRGVGAVGVVMTKAGGRFKTIFTNRITTTEDLEKVEKIHNEGDYWQKVETHNLPAKKKISKQPKVEVIQVSAVEIKEAEPQPATELLAKKPRTRKKKAE